MRTQLALVISYRLGTFYQVTDDEPKNLLTELTSYSTLPVPSIAIPNITRDASLCYQL